VLIGGNTTGKTTFFDVVSFIADIINAKDIDEAIDKRLGGYGNFEDLTHKGEGGDIQFALELRIPEEIRAKLEEKMTRISSNRNVKYSHLGLPYALQV
jgi:predicted ATPase